jgi:hypothetical protein
MTMKNDGGWCWERIYTTMGLGSSQMGVPMTVLQQPSHGVLAIKAFTEATRIAYKPEEGYAGDDTFTTVNDLHNIERVWKVVVTK